MDIPPDQQNTLNQDYQNFLSENLEGENCAGEEQYSPGINEKTDVNNEFSSVKSIQKESANHLQQQDVTTQIMKESPDISSSFTQQVLLASSRGQRESLQKSQRKEMNGETRNETVYKKAYSYFEQDKGDGDSQFHTAKSAVSQRFSQGNGHDLRHKHNAPYERAVSGGGFGKNMNLQAYLTAKPQVQDPQILKTSMVEQNGTGMTGDFRKSSQDPRQAQMIEQKSAQKQKDGDEGITNILTDSFFTAPHFNQFHGSFDNRKVPKLDEDNPFQQQFQTQDDRLKENMLQTNQKVSEIGRKTLPAQVQTFKDQTNDIAYRDPNFEPVNPSHQKQTPKRHQLDLNLSLNLEQILKSHRQERNAGVFEQEIMSGKISNVLMHPQDRKRLKQEEVAGSFKNQVMKSQKSVKTLRSPKSSSNKPISVNKQVAKKYEAQSQSTHQKKVAQKTVQSYRPKHTSKNRKSLKQSPGSSDCEPEAPSPENICSIKPHQMESYRDLRATMHQLNSSSEELDPQDIDRNLSQNSRNRMSDINPKSLNNGHNFSIMMTEVPQDFQKGNKFDQDSAAQDVDVFNGEFIIKPMGFTRQSSGKSDLEKSREAVLQFLMREENTLYKFATEQIDRLQTFINSEGQDDVIDYQLILEKAQVEKSRVFFFVRQLQITFILTRALIKVFTHSLLQRFQIKMQHLCQNIHQNFLLMIDMILKEFLVQGESSSITKSVEYRLLKNITSKKLRSKEKFAKTLTSFRQNNEVNIQNLKKVVKFIIDSYNQESLPYKVLAFDIQEIMRQHLNNLTTNINVSGGGEVRDDFISYINKTITERVNLLSEAQRIGTSRVIDVNKTPVKGLGARKNSHSNYTNIKRSKTGMKKISIGATPGEKVNGSNGNSPITNLSLSSKKHNVTNISNNPYATGQTQMKKTLTQQQKSQSTSGQNIYHHGHTSSQVSLPQQPQRLNDLINAANQGQDQGILAKRHGRKTPMKKSPMKAPQNTDSKQVEEQPPRIASPIGYHLLAPGDIGGKVPNFLKRSGSSQGISNQSKYVSLQIQPLPPPPRRKRYDYTTTQLNAEKLKAANNMQHKLLEEGNSKFFGKKRGSMASGSSKGQPQVQSQVYTGNSSFVSQGMASPQKRGSMLAKKYTVDPVQKTKLSGSGSQSHNFQSIHPVNMPNHAQGYYSPVKQSGTAKKIVRPSSRQGPHPAQKSSFTLNEVNLKLPPQTQQPLSRKIPITQKVQSQKQVNIPRKMKTQRMQDPQYQEQPIDANFYLQPETLAFIMKIQNQQQESSSQNITNVSNNINIYGPVVNHVYQGVDQGAMQEQRRQAQSRQEVSSSNFHTERDIQQHRKQPQNEMNQSQKITQSATTSYPKTSVAQRPTSRQNPQTKNILPRTEPQSAASSNNHKANISIQSSQAITPLNKASNLPRKSGIGSGTKNLERLRQKSSSVMDGAFEQLYQTATQNTKKQDYEEVTPMRKPAKPMPVTEVRDSKFLNDQIEQQDFEQQEKEAPEINIDEEAPRRPVLQVSIEKVLSAAPATPANMILRPPLTFEEDPLTDGESSPVDQGVNPVKAQMDNFNQPLQSSTAVRQYKKHLVSSQFQQHLQNSAPNRNKINKRMFFGEYDATAEEEQSHQNSKMGRYSDSVPFPRSAQGMSPGYQNISTLSPGQSPIGSRHNGSIVGDFEKQSPMIKLQQIHNDSINQGVSEIQEQDKEDSEEEIQNNAPNKIFDEVEGETIDQKVEKEAHKLEEKKNQFAKQLSGSGKTEAAQDETQGDHKNEVEVDDEQAQIDREYKQLRELVTIPYLPPLDQVDPSKWPKRAKNVDEVYTLVLDLDETLIHFEIDDDVGPDEEPGYYLIRPGALKFLLELSDYYEIVVFTAAMPDYADWILDNIDRHNKIQHRLYRQHTTPHEDYAIKDLKNLGRDLSRTIIIDNLAENFNFTTPTNGIWVESWYDDMECTVLSLLIPFLKEIVLLSADVRHVLTEEVKEKCLYNKLDEARTLENVENILQEFAPEHYNFSD